MRRRDRRIHAERSFWIAKTTSLKAKAKLKVRKDKRIEQRNWLDSGVDFSLREAKSAGKTFARYMYEHTTSPIPQSEGSIHDS
jgi:hypothetical protein